MWSGCVYVLIGDRGEYILSLKLMYITNNPSVAQIAEDAGVDCIFVDMECLGKEERQKGMDSVKSFHTVADVIALRQVLKKATLLVRVDPIHSDSSQQIESVIAAGADAVMLPMWKTVEEAEYFLNLVDGRCRTILLLETKEAENCLDEVLELPGVDMVHIGLNDLHLSYHRRFMFELLADGTVERICRRLRRAGVSYGFGGVGRIGSGIIPAEHILGEHIRLGSNMVILSRSFCDLSKVENLCEIQKRFQEGVKDLRACEAQFRIATLEDLKENQRQLCEEVAGVAERLGRGSESKGG